jgi:hypothetical protein
MIARRLGEPHTLSIRKKLKDIVVEKQRFAYATRTKAVEAYLRAGGDKSNLISALPEDDNSILQERRNISDIQLPSPDLSNDVERERQIPGMKKNE